MEQIIVNKDCIQEKEITEIVKRVKAIIINSKNEILLGYSHNDYQFLGGHVENGENLIESLKREISEESGISLNLDDVFPIILRKAYYKDYPQIGNNRKNEIYYYVIKTDKLPNLELTNLTDDEKDGNFKLKYIKLDDIEEVIIKNGDKNGDPHGIANEMLEVIKIYKNKFLK